MGMKAYLIVYEPMTLHYWMALMLHQSYDQSSVEFTK